MADSDRVLSAARRDYDDAAALLAEHDRLCVPDACPRRITLVAHLHRTARQLALLAPPADPDPLF